MARLVILVCLMGLLVISATAFAQNEEKITLTTYYPSPYGSYGQLDVNNLTITNSPGSTGLINFPGGATNPTTGSPGSIYFNTSAGEFMFMDNTNTWRSLHTGAVGNNCKKICFTDSAGSPLPSSYGCDYNIPFATNAWIDCRAYHPGSLMTGVWQTFNGASYYDQGAMCCK